MRTTKNPFTIENLEEDTGFLLLQVSRLWAERHERVLKKRFSLSYMQSAVLMSVFWLVLHRKHEVTQTILAEHTKIDPMTISQIFKVLEKKGLIYRQKHSTNVRAKAVYLTEEGEELMHKVVPTIADVNGKFFKTLGKYLERFNDYMLSLLKANE